MATLRGRAFLQPNKASIRVKGMSSRKVGRVASWTVSRVPYHPATADRVDRFAVSWKPSRRLSVTAAAPEDSAAAQQVAPRPSYDMYIYVFLMYAFLMTSTLLPARLCHLLSAALLRSNDSIARPAHHMPAVAPPIGSSRPGPTSPLRPPTSQMPRTVAPSPPSLRSRSSAASSLASPPRPSSRPSTPQPRYGAANRRMPGF